MRPQELDLVLLIGGPERARRTIENLLFAPPLRVRSLPGPPEIGGPASEPLLYLLGQSETLGTARAITGWLDRLADAEAAPVALLTPRPGEEWAAATAHPQFCGLLPCDPEVQVEQMERILSEARRIYARRWGRRAIRRGQLAWSFPTSEAADIERTWLLIESVLTGLVGTSPALARLGMAFGEALTNAVEHGNLELDSAVKELQPDGMLRFFEERRRRLQDPALSRRRIHVAVSLRGPRLRVRLRHEGLGCDPEQMRPSSPVRAAAPHGLGMLMIRSLVDRAAISSDGRTVILEQRIEGGPRLPDVVPFLPPGAGAGLPEEERAGRELRRPAA